MVSSRQRVSLAILVFVAASLSFFSYYGSNNDHFDRLARARQIAVFGEVPFRDFFDPGYFLTLYSSALVQRLFGDNLFGELLLNVSFMALGTTLVFLLASEVSRSTLYGLIASGLVAIAEPRMYDYDKVLFYPLGLYVCWKYIDRPTFRSLLFVSAVTVLAGLFRYDSAIYLGAAAIVAIGARHWGSWKIAGQRLLQASVVMLLFASPALIFIQATAGLGDALDQVTTYATREGARTKLFQPVDFEIDWARPFVQVTASDGDLSLWRDVDWLPGFSTGKNAIAWLYAVAVGLPLVAALILPWGLATRGRPDVAKLLCYATAAELVALFILRDPLTARMGGAMSLIAIGGGTVIAEWLQWLRRPQPSTTGAFLTRGLIAGCGVVVCLVTFVSISALVWFPRKSNLQFARRLSEYARTPTSMELLPRGELQSLAEYIRDCTKPSDRVLATWFVGELYFFSGRGFAAGLPVIFGDHWSELRYQRRSLSLLENQSVPIVVTHEDEFNGSQFDFLWAYITEHYELAGEMVLPGVGGNVVTIWTRRGLQAERVWGPLSLPCFAAGNSRS